MPICPIHHGRYTKFSRQCVHTTGSLGLFKTTDPDILFDLLIYCKYNEWVEVIHIMDRSFLFCVELDN